MTEPSDAESDSGSREIDRLEIALRVTATELDPERITRMLGVAPTLAGRKGETVDHAGVPVTQRTGTWTYALPTSPEWELGDAIDTLLEQLPADPALWESIAAWADVAVVCGLYVHDIDRAADIEPDTLARLAERRLALRIEIRGVESE